MTTKEFDSSKYVPRLKHVASYFDYRSDVRITEATAVSELLWVARRVRRDQVDRVASDFEVSKDIKIGKGPTLILLYSLLFKGGIMSGTADLWPWEGKDGTLSIPKGFGFSGFVELNHHELKKLVKRHRFRSKIELDRLHSGG